MSKKTAENGSAAERTATLSLPNVVRFHACAAWAGHDHGDRSPAQFAARRKLFRALARDWADDWATVAIVGLNGADALKTPSDVTINTAEAKAWEDVLSAAMAGKPYATQEMLSLVLEQLSAFIKG